MSYVSAHAIPQEIRDCKDFLAFLMPRMLCISEHKELQVNKDVIVTFPLPLSSGKLAQD